MRGTYTYEKGINNYEIKQFSIFILWKISICCANIKKFVKYFTK